jgi:hypothetical protein
MPNGNANNSENIAPAESNPNFFYNEDVFIQQALQESLLDRNNGGRPQNQQESYNQILQDALVMSRKEFDDIGRKKIEDEIERIKHDPDAIHKKIEGMLKEKKIVQNSNKLPPLRTIGKISAASRGMKKDLKSMKAPILQMNQEFNSKDTIGGRDRNDRNINETESEIDIKETTRLINDNEAPSYNPRLLQNDDNKGRHDAFFSMPSNEFADEVQGFKPNNMTTEDDEFNNLMKDLADDEPSSKLPNPRISNTKVHYSGVKNTNILEKQNSHDSFDELMSGINGSNNQVNNGPPGAAHVQIIRNSDNYNDFSF